MHTALFRFFVILIVAGQLACRPKSEPAATSVEPAEPSPSQPDETPEQAPDLPEGVVPPASEPTQAQAPSEEVPAVPAAAKPTSAANAKAASKPAAPLAEKTEKSPALPAPKPTAPKPAAPAATDKPAAPVAEAKPAAPAPAAAPARKTTLPKTAHVRYVVDAAMQKLLDKDSRMEAWLKRITPVIDACYRGLSGQPTGVVQLNVTMHQNSRPGVAIKSLPGNLAGLMPCATSKLMNERSPLFTGPEGERHTVSIHFY